MPQTNETPAGGPGLDACSSRQGENIIENEHYRPKKQASVAVSNPKLIRQKLLICTVDLELPSGLIIGRAMLLESSGSRWIGFPSEPYKKPDGSKGWKPFIEFASKAAGEEFQARVLPLAEQALLGGRQ